MLGEQARQRAHPHPGRRASSSTWVIVRSRSTGRPWGADETGRPWGADEEVAEAALAFLRTMVTPEYRGPDSGFFDAEVEVSAGAGAFERLLGFAGRDPRWTP